MSHFYKKVLEEQEQLHAAAMAASQKKVYGPQAGPPPEANLTISKPPELAPKSDVELAEQARQEGKDVEVNDEGQIVDKRELLAAGLNLSLPNTRNLALQKARAARGESGDGDAPPVHTAVGVAASRREINERRAREVRQQMEEEQQRQAESKRQAEEESRRRIVAKRNNEDDVMSAKERYLARKRQRLEQGQGEEGSEAAA